MNLEFIDELHWNNSANVLCNYMDAPEYLHLVLKNRAIIPRYVMEPIGYLNINNINTICFPMTCFCDIPFSKVATHMSRYGKYGIGLDKVSMIYDKRVQPIHYINENSPLTDDFREAFTSFYDADKRIDKSSEVLLDYLVSTIVYMKPIMGQEKNDKGELETYVYQDECEWRYIPSDNFPEELKPIIIPQSEMSKKTCEAYSDTLTKHEECWLKFDWKDVHYLMVPDEMARDDTVDVIKKLELKEKEKDILISKIEISGRFSDNM